MKRSHITSALAILSVAFLVPLSASATTTTATASKTAPATTAKSATATKSATSAKTASASKIGLHHHSTAKNASATKTPKAPKIDLNSATREELMTLPGVDGTMADKIIADRPYKSMSQLTSKKVVTKAEYAKIKSHVTARQSTMQHSEAPATPASGDQGTGAAASDAAAGTTDNSTTTK